jgi:hypothetical protein
VPAIPGAKSAAARKRVTRKSPPREPEFVYGPGEEPRPREGEPTGWHKGDLL